jgi:hypothetical protein
MTIGTASIGAAPAAERQVVLHVTNFSRVQPRALVVAEDRATQVYRAAGMQVVWTEGPAPATDSGAALHLQVLLLSADMVQKLSWTTRLGQGTFGLASQPVKRAHIFVERIAQYAIATRSDLSCVLATVLAHEVGHLLLPASSHAASGIMRGVWHGQIANVPGFTNAQAATMRRRLAEVSTS